MDNDGTDKSSISESNSSRNQTNHGVTSTAASVANVEFTSQKSVAPGPDIQHHTTNEVKDDSAGSMRLYGYLCSEVKDFFDSAEKPGTSTNGASKNTTERSEAREQIYAYVSKWLHRRIDEEYLFVANNFISGEVPNISEFCKEQLIESLLKLDENVSSGSNHVHSTNSSGGVSGTSNESCEKLVEIKKLPKDIQGENETHHRVSEISTTSIMCRICYHESWGTPDLGPLVSPCNCRGSVQMVHMACLQRWLSESGTDTCDLCGYRFRVRWIQRTSLLNSFFAWICTEEEAMQLLTDLALLFVMTPLVIFTAHRCLEASHILFVDRRISHLLLVSLLLFFGYFAQVSYYFWIISAFFYHAHNWMRWWRQNFGIEILPPDTS